MPRRPSPATRAAAAYVTGLGAGLAVLPAALLVDGLRAGHLAAAPGRLLAVLTVDAFGTVCWPVATLLLLAAPGIARREAGGRRAALAALAVLAALAAPASWWPPAEGLAAAAGPAVAAGAGAGMAALLRPAVRRDFTRPALRVV